MKRRFTIFLVDRPVFIHKWESVFSTTAIEKRRESVEEISSFSSNACVYFYLHHLTGEQSICTS